MSEIYQSREEEVYASCRADAEAKLRGLLFMLQCSDPRQPAQLAEMAIAAECTAVAVRRLYQVNLAGAENGLA